MSKSGSNHRLFFALRPDEATLDAIMAVQATLACKAGRPVPRSRVHITLLFLGHQSGSTLERLASIAAGIDFKPCRLTLDHLGHFARSAVAWLGVEALPPALNEFQQRLCHAVATAGIEFDDRPWRPHLTLYRDLRKRPARMMFEPVEWRVEEFELLESVHCNNRLEYVCQGRWAASTPG